MSIIDDIGGESFEMRGKSPTRRQPVKNGELSLLGLTRLHRDGCCPFEALEADAESAGLTGRISLQLGEGVGGKDGMHLFRGSAREVAACRENVWAMVGWITKGLGAARFAAWLSEQGLTEEEFGTWYRSLPKVR
jgi:hypothetical protein